MDLDHIRIEKLSNQIAGKIALKVGELELIHTEIVVVL